MTAAAPSPAPMPKGLVRFGGPPAADVRTRRIYCLPFAGGGPSAYRLWSRSLPDRIDMVAVQLPGRDPSSRAGDPPASIPALVEAVSQSIVEMEEVDPLPFVLFGHSMGALLAYEATLVLEERSGPSPDRLFVSGRRPPDELTHRDPIHALPDEEFLDAMHRSYGGIPAAVRDEPELLALFLPSLRADIRALETYEPRAGRVVGCPVRVYGGVEDRNPRPSQLGGWQRVAATDVSIRVFEGGHFYLNDRRDLLVADIVDHC